MIVGTCWYLAGLCLLSSVVQSLITVLPGREPLMARVIIGSVVASFLFAATAVFLRSRDWRWIHHSKLAKNVLVGLAGLATVLLVPLIVG